MACCRPFHQKPEALPCALVSAFQPSTAVGQCQVKNRLSAALSDFQWEAALHVRLCPSFRLCLPLFISPSRKSPNLKIHLF